jgi:phosphoserine aminotransferase
MAVTTLYNFNAGPAILPRPVLEQAQAELLELPGVGLSVLEISHRSADFDAIIQNARDGIRKLYGLNDDFDVLFLQGGASLQFEMLPLNLLREGDEAQYFLTGSWGQKAFAAARSTRRWTGAEIDAAFSDEAAGFTRAPEPGEYKIDGGARYVHFTSNETIHGVQWQSEPQTGGVPLVADVSSDMLSRPIDAGKYGFIYGGAQKNLGPSGVTVVIIRRDFLYEKDGNLPKMLDYHTQIGKESFYNTPNTFGIYIISLVCNWLETQGGLTGIAQKNAEKAALLYEAIDNSGGFYYGHAQKESRSVMNVPFRLGEVELEKEFIVQATSAGFVGIKGHRDVGGLRASLYNALPREAVEALVDFMNEFAKRHG